MNPVYGRGLAAKCQGPGDSGLMNGSEGHSHGCKYDPVGGGAAWEALKHPVGVIVTG